MESASLPIPRLRLSRYPPSDIYGHAGEQSTSQAGPSRLPDIPSIDVNISDRNDNNDDDDQQATPKLSFSTAFKPVSTSSPAETPAARLRALLSRVSNHSSSSVPHVPVAPTSPSELESDFEGPRFGSATPSIARESLKDIFSRALRDPGDTPQKGRPRRNSVDVSEVEASPRVEEERAKNKGKRKSLSDEEIETFSKSSQRSDASLKSTQADAFDTLRERLSISHTQLQDQLPSSLYEHTHGGDSNDTAPILPHLVPSRKMPTTSTPQDSLRMSLNSQLPFQSNLLEQDSEMQQAIAALDSYEGDSGRNQRPLSFPPSRPTNLRPSPSQPQMSPSHSKSNSLENSKIFNSFVRRGREDAHRSSSRSSSRSSTGRNKQVTHDEPDRTHEREREWNKPHPKNHSHSETPEFKHQHSHGRLSKNSSPTVSNGRLSRQGSAASLRSLDDDSSKGSSFGSQAEYRERIDELERERNIEREREWNKRHSLLPRPSSSLSQHSPQRLRTYSQPARPDSAQSLLSPKHAHRLFTGRTISPTGSRSSHDGKDESEDEIIQEVVHERERNWNAPRPKWHQHSSDMKHNVIRSTSPLPPSPSRSLSSTQPRLGRARAESLQTLDSKKAKSSTRREETSSNSSLALPMKTSSRAPSPRGKPSTPNSPSRKRPATKQLPNYLARSYSPSQLLAASTTSNNGSKPRTGYSNDIASDAENEESLSQERTPTMATIAPPPVEEIQHVLIEEDIPTQSSSPPLPRQRGLNNDEALLHKDSDIVVPESPLPSPPAEARPPTDHSVLATPPRQSSFNNTRIEFQTPSPPRGLPELPGPPSSSEDEREVDQRTPEPLNDNYHADFTAMKTPKPPGAWSSTPLPVRESLPRTHSLSMESDDAQYGGGLATPVASLSKASAMPFQTPAPPGAWMATPALRKSIRKVRFDTPFQEPPSEEIVEPLDKVEDVQKVSDTSEIGRHEDATTSLSVSAAETMDVGIRTPESPSTPSIPFLQTPRKSPGIRIVDAFGRDSEVISDVPPPETPRSKSSVRIVDAMGREVERDDQFDDTSSVQSSDLPLKHSEALVRVRQGLSDLAQSLDDMDRTSRDDPLDIVRLQELDTVSRASRETRGHISQALQTKETDLRKKYEASRDSMNGSKTLLPGMIDRRLSGFQVSSWMFLIVLLLQLLLVLIMYRLSISRAKDLFLTTYYDPFYPDLHLYTINPDTLRRSAISSQSRVSAFDALRHEGLKAFLFIVWDNLSMFISGWQKHLWETWGHDRMQQNIPWPPT